MAEEARHEILAGAFGAAFEQQVDVELTSSTFCGQHGAGTCDASEDAAHLPATRLRDLLLEALDETGRDYELIDKLISPISEIAAASIRISGHSFTIMIGESKQ